MNKRPLTLLKTFLTVLTLVVSVGTYKYVIAEMNLVSTQLAEPVQATSEASATPASSH